MIPPNLRLDEAPVRANLVEAYVRWIESENPSDE
jgi:hypothetical protein